MSVDQTFEELTGHLKRLSTLNSIGGLLGWDQRVNLPQKSSPNRAEQMAVYAEILHRESSDPRIGELIVAMESEKKNLNPDQQAIVREARRDYDLVAKVPQELATRFAKARSLASQAWIEAREKNDFNHFAPFLERNLELAKEQATSLGAQDAYDFWIDIYDPGMTKSVIEAQFDAFLPQLQDLLEKILAAENQPDDSFFRGFPVEKQEAFARKVVEKIGFDFDYGRMDISAHPFCGGDGQDIRMTTRYTQDRPLESLMAAIHETGHALYKQGLPHEWRGTALGYHVGMAVHESQSTIWEKQVGRSRAFWKFFEPAYRESFAAQLDGVSSEDFFKAVNKVAINPIRVSSDSLTYGLHIMLRFELEKRLFEGSLAVNDLPDAWIEASERIIGYTPKDHREAVLQDMHWSMAAFGYFPSYLLGTMIGAQMWEKVLVDLPGLYTEFESGNFRPLLDWLRKHVHSKGRRLNTLEFVKDVTGEELSCDYLEKYLKNHYLPLYQQDRSGT